MKQQKTNRLKIIVYLVCTLLIFPCSVWAWFKNHNPAPRQNKTQKPQFAPDEIILKLKPEADKRMPETTDAGGKVKGIAGAGNNIVTGPDSLDSLHKKYGVRDMRRIVRKRIQGISSTIKKKRSKKMTPQAEKKFESLSRIYRAKLKQGTDVLKAVADYQKNPNVEYAEPNYIYHITSTPNDPYFNQLWGLHNTGQNGGTPDTDIDAPEAWEINKGNKNIIVAVIDSGVDYTHQDLAANMWTNPGEIPGNGIDDDGNGYVDDVYGIDAKNSDSDPMDDLGHGTHVSGTIGAVGNNSKGVVGVNWDVSIMALKFLGSDNWGYSSDAVECIYYAIYNGAHIMSNSWIGDTFSKSLKEAIDSAENAGILFVAAAGNSGVNIDSSPVYPAGYDNENIIAVAATDRNDNLASFSNYGTVSVDVAAPGVNIYSTVYNPNQKNTYESWSGTSMATPHVSGLAALIIAEYWYNYNLNGDIDPPGNISYIDVKESILQAVDPLPGLSGRIATGGRINAYSSLTYICSDYDNDGYYHQSGCGTLIDCDDIDASVYPGATELCDGTDNDCDGNTDEVLPQLCGTTDVGECEYGILTCIAGNWSACDGNVEPSTEGCDNLDNDCDGITDSITRSCYTGPSDTQDVGECKGGTQTCTSGNWGGCIDEVGPTDETCDELDNNCDGETDENGVCPTKLDVSIEITSPVRICVNATQVCGEDGPIFRVVPDSGSEKITPVDNPCQDNSDLIYCVDYDESEDLKDTIVDIWIDERTPCVPESPGFAIARFKKNLDHDYATSSCITEDGGIVSLIPDLCKPDDVSVEVEIGSGNLDLSGAGLSSCYVGVLMSIVNIDPTTDDLSIPNIPIVVYDISLPDGGNIASGRNLTVRLNFELTDGFTRSNYDSGARVFEIKSCDEGCDNMANWISVGTPTVVWASQSPDETEGTFTFTTDHLTTFAATSKSTQDSSGDGDSDGDNSGTQALGGGGGGSSCSVTPTIKSASMGSAIANTLILLLPLLIAGIRKRKK